MQKKYRIMQFPEEKKTILPSTTICDLFIHSLKALGDPSTRNKKVFITSTFYSFKKF